MDCLFINLQSNVKRKVLKYHRAVLISISLALNQTPVYTVKP